MSPPPATYRRAFKLRTVFFVLLLTGCAATPPQSTVPPAGPGGDPRVSPATGGYAADASYYLLMAEIALQRRAWLVTAREYQNAAGLSNDPELAQRATEFAYEYGFDVIALGSVLRWLELQPDDSLANEYAAQLYLRRNQIDRALSHWRVSLGSAELTADESLRVGADMAEQGNPDGATKLLARLLNTRPNDAGLRMALAYAALRSGAYELSLASARRVAAVNEEWIHPRLVIPKALLSMGREYEAFEYLDDALAQHPSTVLELEYVRLLSAVGRQEDALRRLLDLGKVYGAQPELVKLHGLISFAIGDLNAAQKDYEQLLSSGNDIYESHFMLGRIAMARQEFGRAIESFARIRGGGYLVQAQLAISACYELLGNDEAALEQLREFAAEYPRFAFDVVGAEARLLYRMGMVDEALVTYDRMLQLKPDQADLLLEYGALLDLAGKYVAAVARMEHAFEIAPTSQNVLNTLGYTLANRTRRYDEAYSLIRMALQLDPYSAPTIDSMGWVLYRIGRLEEARSYLEMALSEMEDPELIAHLGEVLWVSDEREEALALWDRALIDYPDSQPLIETRQRFVQ